MYDETITLFNRYEDQTGNVFWYPTVLQHVDLITDKVANIVRTGIDSADTASLHVAYTPDNGTIVVQGKKWLSPKAWKDHFRQRGFLCFGRLLREERTSISYRP